MANEELNDLDAVLQAVNEDEVAMKDLTQASQGDRREMPGACGMSTNTHSS